SYVAWLRLMIAPFDATNNILLYINGGSTRKPFESISISILSAPEPSTTLLHWRDLFTRNIIPTTDGTEIGMKKNNDDILDYLDKGITKA
ncbi:hypothetical protein BDN70DRAFT_786491, partial [Pholiota conissans]